MMSKEFICAMCNGEFVGTSTEKDALKEMESYFGEVPEKYRVIICDECFNKIHPKDHPVEVAEAKKKLLEMRARGK